MMVLKIARLREMGEKPAIIFPLHKGRLLPQTFLLEDLDLHHFFGFFVSNVTSCARGDSQAPPAPPRAPVSRLGGTGLQEPEQWRLI